MNLQAIEMPKDKAIEALMAYRSAVRERHNEEFAACVRGYQALARGKKIISLVETVRRGGTDENGCPRLAVARADLREITFRRWQDGRVDFDPERWPHWRRRKQSVHLPAGTLPAGREIDWKYRAIVPFVPPQYLPKRGALELFHILFEAEWSMTPPVDPALLRHLGGDLWVVVTTWNLTPLEQLVLGGRGTRR
jgi:hypothetical protein